MKVFLPLIFDVSLYICVKYAMVQKPAVIKPILKILWLAGTFKLK